MGENDLDLEQQLATLGVSLGGITSSKDEIPVPKTTVATPYTPENPTNAGVVTNSIVQPAQTVQQTVQQQVNEQAQAQVVQQTTTNPQAGVSYTTVQQTVSKPVAKPQLQPQQDEELVFIDLAHAVNTQKTPWLRLKDNEYSRVLFLGLDKILPQKMHYIKGLGWCKCLSTYNEDGWLETPAQCCKKLVNTPTGPMLFPRLDEEGNELKAKSRFLIPVIEYPVDKSNANKIVPGQLPKLKMWNMNAVEWGELREGVQAISENPDDLSTADLSNVDFILHKDTTGRFKTISVKVTPKCLRENYKDAINAEIAKADRDFYITAVKEARKVVSEETMAQTLDSLEAATEAVNNAVNQVIENNTMGNQMLDI